MPTSGMVLGLGHTPTRIAYPLVFVHLVFILNTDARGAASAFQLHLEVCKHKVISHWSYLAPGKGISMCALVMLDLKHY